MQIVQTLQSINIITDNIDVFLYFKRLMSKNFTKLIGRKNTIFSFFEESEIPQRRYFIKLLNQKYYKNTHKNIQNLQEAHFKTFKLSFKQSNVLKPVLFIELSFSMGRIFMKLSSNEKLFLTYIRNYFKDHDIEYDLLSRTLILKYKDESTFELFEAFADESEHLKYSVNFKVERDEYEQFCQNIHNKESMKWKFNALAKLFSHYFSTLECTPKNDLNQIRQKYLIMVKLYHPDFYQNKSAIEKAYAREKFEKIQMAYDNLKTLYKNNI